MKGVRRPRRPQAPVRARSGVCGMQKVEYGIPLIHKMGYKEEFIKLGGGGAQPNISKEKIVSTYIPLPPNAEQIRIIKTIHQLFDQLDIITESL